MRSGAHAHTVLHEKNPSPSLSFKAFLSWQVAELWFQATLFNVQVEKEVNYNLITVLNSIFS